MSLAAENIDLVPKIASKVRSLVGQRAERDELIGEGMFGLLDAEKAYMENGITDDFRTYAVVFIRRAMIDRLRRDWGHRFKEERINIESLNRTVSKHDDQAVTFLDLIPDLRADTESIIELRETLVERAILGNSRPAVLSPAELDALVAAAAGESGQETAKRTGRSVETVKTQRKNVIKKLGAVNMTNACYLAARAGLLDEVAA